MLSHHRLIGTLFIAVSTIIIGVSVVSAQPGAYKAKQIDQTLEARAEAINRALRSGNIDADRQGIEAFFNNYYFPRWTDMKNEAKLYSYRNDLLKNDLGNAQGNAKTYLLGKAFSQLSLIAADDTVFPAARFNAMLTIGMLNTREAGSGNTPPVPYPEALPYLLKEYEKQNLLPFLKVATLQGIVRHVQCGVAAEADRNAATLLLRKIVKDGTPADGRSEDEQELLDWHRDLAIQGLQAIRHVGNRAETVDLLLNVIESEKESPALRFAAMRAMGDLDFAGAQTGGITVPTSQIVDGIVQLSRFACEDELKRINDLLLIDPSLGAAPTMGGMSGEFMSSDSGSGMPAIGAIAKIKASDAIQESMARTKSAFFSIRNAIQGKASGFSSPDATGIQPIVESDQVLWRKLRNLSTELQNACNFFDQGPPAPKKPPVDMFSSSSGSDMMTAPPVDPNAPKVTLGMIQEKLQEVSLKINELMAN